MYQFPAYIAFAKNSDSRASRSSRSNWRVPRPAAWTRRVRSISTSPLPPTTPPTPCSPNYQTTLADTRDLLDPVALERAAELLDRARGIDIYTQSHNLYPAQMFCDRLLSIGRSASCFESGERQARIALASDCHHVAIAISYSGLGPNLATILPILHERNVPTIFVGTPNGCRLNPGLEVYLHVSDRESLQNRITQFASHIAVQYVLDSLYGCLFARDYANSRAFLERSLPATSLPALRRTELSPTEYASVMLNRLR